MSDGVISQVDFLLDGSTLVGSVASAPYNLNATISAAPGPHTITIHVHASDGTTTFDSSPTTFNVVTAVGNGPSVNITSPTSSAGIAVGANVTITATASDNDGFIPTSAPGGVTFYVDGDPIGTDLTAPYSITWTPTVAKNNVSLVAQAIDDKGNTQLSSPVLVSVAQSSTPISASLTSPPNGSAVTVGVASTLTATGNPSPGATISQIQFLVGGTVVGTANSPGPYSFSWTPPSAGTFSLTAKVIDSLGNSATSSAVSVTAIAGTTSGVTLDLSPSNPSIAAGTSRIVTATVPSSISAARVDLFLDGQLVGTDTTAPFSFIFTAPQSLGPHTLRAVVTSPNGAENTSSPLSITIGNVIGSAPAVSISAPSSGSFLGVGANTTISGTVSDSDGSISSVQVYVNGATTGLANAGVATVTGPTWSIVWTPATTGTASIVAIATDNNGNAVAAPPVGVTVADSASPGLSLTLSPHIANVVASSTLPSGAVRNIVADAQPSAGRAIVRVEFFVDGTKVGEDTSAPYTFRYVAPQLAADEQTHTYVFSARATDNAGAARDAQLPLLVVAPIGQPPTVSLLTPTNNTSVTPSTAVSLAATAVANGGSIASVQFYVNGSPTGVNAGNALSIAPYTSTFTPTAPGVYVIDAIATDDRGNTSISNSATITAAFATPTVTITSPNPNATARATPGVPLNLAATAVVQSGAGASVLLVEFLLDGVQIGADTTAPYTFAWTPSAAQIGAHVLTARVTDTNSQTSTSAPVNVNVAVQVGAPPTISITQPTAGTGVGQAGNLQTLSTVNFVANASSPSNGVTINSVEFFLNDTSIGTAAREQTSNLWRLAYDFSRFDFSTAPSVTDPNTGITRYTPIPLYAIARDSNNNQTVTNPLNLTVNPSTSAPPSVQLTTFSQTTITQNQQFLMLPNFNDSDGTVTQIQVYANGAPSGAAIGNPQPGQILTYNGTTAGRFNIYLVVTDDTGNTAVSTPSVVVTVNAIAAPVTALTRPSDDTTTTTVGAPVFLEGTASSPDPTQVPLLTFVASGSGAQRQQIVGTRVGTTTTYRAIWTPTVADTYSVTTQATIGGTATANSPTSRRVVVSNLSGLAPSVTLTAPTTTTTASVVNLTATATDSDGSVVEVEFFLNRNSIGLAKKDDQANTWRITASFAGITPGSAEVVALARDSSGNVAASPTSTVTVTAASSIAPSITISPSTTNAPFNRQLQLTSTASDTDGTVTNVQYFANATSLGNTGNSGSNFLVNWTPTVSGTFNVYGVATDNTGNTVVSPTVQVVVRRNNPVLEDAAFILQTYQDIANTTTINPIVFANLDASLSGGTTTRADVVASLVGENGFVAPVNLLAAYRILMGQWPTPQNYTTLLATARGSLANAMGSILSSNEYFAKYGTVPTVALLNNPSSSIPAQTFLNRLYQNAGLGSPSALQVVQFMSNDTASPVLGRGYNVAGLNTALSEFVTLTNSGNTALFNQARAAALFYQLDRPPASVTVDDITARIAQLVQLGAGKSTTDAAKAIAEVVLKDQLYTYRYVTFLKHPTSLVVAPRSGALFSVEAIGSPQLSYQWLLNGAPIPNATNALLSLTNVDTTRVGTYTAVVTSGTGISSTSDPATLTLSNTPTRLANISTRGVTTAGANVLIGGFVVTGANATQTRQMLIRVIGPTLGNAPFNVAGFLANPRLEVYSGSNPNPVLTNDDWGTQTGGAAQVTAIQQATNRAGAFALAPASLDAVVLATLPPGNYTVQAKGPVANANASGVVLIEVYDVTGGAAAGPKAANVSTRGQVGTNTNILIAGFVVNGAVSRRILIRGAGPTLTGFGVPGVLADPQLTLIDQATGATLRTNDDWASGADAAIIAQAAVSAGAFPLANGSKDAAMIIMLAPGAYTVQLSGVNNTTGVGIVEVYDVDP